MLFPKRGPGQVDFEAELAIVLGQALKNADASEALDAVLGVTGANDVSARRCPDDSKRALSERF